MKKIIYFSFFVFLACNVSTENPKENFESDHFQNAISIDDLIEKSLEIEIIHNDINKSEIVDEFNEVLRSSISSTDSIKLLKISEIILLKQYLYHLRRSNQGYNLLHYRRGHAKGLIDVFFNAYDIDPNSEFVNSAAPYNFLIENKKYSENQEIREIIDQITFEDNRIIEQSQEIINKYK